jgi:hypothetical protein
MNSKTLVSGEYLETRCNITGWTTVGNEAEREGLPFYLKENFRDLVTSENRKHSITQYANGNEIDKC